MSDRRNVAIGSDVLTVEIDPCGAELQRIVDRDGRDYLWNGDPTWWVGRAPLLFPIVGALRDGAYRLDGATYRLPKHGFARVSTFEIVSADANAATFRLTDTAEMRAQYPFEFALDVTYGVTDNSLSLNVNVANRGRTPMPMSFGVHPALRWPLPDAGPRDAHILRFAESETGPTFRWDENGLVTPRAYPNPIENRTLHPTDALFCDDAVFFPAPASRSLWFGVPGAPGVALAWDVPELGIWTKPGAPFLCVEPWQGHNDPQGFDSDFTDKPGIVEIAPERSWATGIRFDFGVNEPG